MSVEKALKAIDREIEWFESHRDYFQTTACANTAISRLKGRREQVERILNLKCGRCGEDRTDGDHGLGRCFSFRYK